MEFLASLRALYSLPAFSVEATYTPPLAYYKLRKLRFLTIALVTSMFWSVICDSNS